MRHHLLFVLALLSGCSTSPFADESHAAEELLEAHSIEGHTWFLASVDDRQVLGRFEAGSFVVEHDLLDRHVRDFWGGTHDDLWIAGSGGLEHFDGSAWSSAPMDAGRDAYVSQVAGVGDEVFAIARPAEDASARSILLRHTSAGFVADDERTGYLGATPGDLFLFTDDGVMRRSGGDWVTIEPPPFGWARVAGERLVAMEGASVAVHRGDTWDVLPQVPLRDTEREGEEGDGYEQVDELLVVGDEVVARVDVTEYGCWSGALFAPGGCGYVSRRLEILRHTPTGGWVRVGDVDPGSWENSRLVAIDGEVWLTSGTDAGTQMGHLREPLGG